MISENPGVPTLNLHNGLHLPPIGLGTFKAQGEKLKIVVKCALQIGIRHIDTASIYRNHRDIAEAIREAGVAREDVFITTKIGPHQALMCRGWGGLTHIKKEELLVQQGEGKARLACEEALQSLCSGYVDLLLIHWPGVVKTGLDSQRNAIKRMETWSVMEDFYRSGRCRAIGVSNYEERHLLELMQSARVKPMVNQIEVHPRFPQTALRAFCREHNIAVVAYASLGCGDLLDNMTVRKVAETHRKAPAQVLLRWGLQQGCAVIPKTVSEEHLRQYGDDALLSWSLTDDAMEALDELEDGHKYCWNPAPIR